MVSDDRFSPVVDGRDLRIDYLRGFVMFVLVIAHTEVFSLYNLIAWERIGLVSGAGGFVMLSGLVVGMVYGARVRKKGLGEATQSLVDRALQLYRANVFIIGSVFLLRAFTIVDVREVTTFTDRAAGVTAPLFTDPAGPLMNKIIDVLLLRAGPHQIQILGLYVVVLMVSPLALWLMAWKRTGVLLLISWVCYFYAQAFPGALTSAQFENAFPILAWQVYYFTAMAVGYHRQRVFDFLRSRVGMLVFAIAALIAAALFVFAQFTPNPYIPHWARLSGIDPGTFNAVHDEFFQKNTLRIGRVVNWFALFLVLYWLLTRFWRVANRALGWFFIPLGQNSLYVFIVHVYVVLLISNVIPFGFSIPPVNILFNTVVHTIALAVLWLMVRYQVLFGWVPR